MKKFLLVLLAVALVGGVTTGCKTKKSGSREYIPGKGWKPTN